MPLATAEALLTPEALVRVAQASPDLLLPSGAAEVDYAAAQRLTVASDQLYLCLLALRRAASTRVAKADA